MDDDGGVEDAFRVGAPSAGDESGAGECRRREAVKNGTEYLVRKAISEVGVRSTRQWKSHRCRRRREMITRAMAMEENWVRLR